MNLPEIRRTPLEFLPNVSRELNVDVWVKREDATNPRTGGNKVRKLRPLLEDAATREATHLLTVGAAGSNHVLTTALHGRELGLNVHGVLVPHPDSDAVREVLVHTISLGATLTASHGEVHAAWLAIMRWLRLRREGFRPYYIPPGGTNVLSTGGCLAAGAELLAQIENGEMPSVPEAIYCVLGTGGTAAGLGAALSRSRSATQLVAVLVYPGPFINRHYVLRLMRRVPPEDKNSVARWAHNFRVDKKWIGDGYGFPSEPARRAQELFARDGLYLDLTYTARAGAALIEHARVRKPTGPLLLWYTHPNFSFETDGTRDVALSAIPERLKSVLMRN